MQNKSTNTIPKTLKLSPRRKIILTKSDKQRIEKLKIKLPFGWKAELKKNTSIDSRTIDNALCRGNMELKVIDKLRKYLDLLDEAEEREII